MDARFYNSEEIDIERLARDLVNVYLAQGYQAQDIGNKDQMMVQLKKGGDFEAIIGMQAALSLNIQRTTGGVLATIGQQRWIDKAAVGAVGIVAMPILWPLALTAGVGALRQASLGNQVLNMLDGLVRQQKPNVVPGPIPYNVMPQAQQQWAPPPTNAPYYTPPPNMAQQQPAPTPMATPAPIPRPAPVAPTFPPAAPAQLRCSHCNTPYEAGDTFCTGCGRSLTPPRAYCSKCNAELKPGIAFCPKCGASTFQATSAAQSAPAPTYTSPAPAPTYTPPQPAPKVPPAKPYYTPSPQATPQASKAPEVPYYTPPPATPAVDPHAAPTVASQPATPAPKKPVEPFYVPPKTQTPSVVPQPKVTMVPGQKKKETPPAAPPPQKVYYTPPVQTGQAVPGQAQPDPALVPTLTPTQPQSVDPNAVWGSLIFSDGEQVELKGEHAVVGRYDHDLGGVQPDVDLGKKQGADTVSRVHAAIEHIGSMCTLTDLNSTNSTRLNGKRLEPDKPTPLNDGDSLDFGKVSCTFKKM